MADRLIGRRAFVGLAGTLILTTTALSACSNGGTNTSGGGTGASDGIAETTAGRVRGTYQDGAWRFLGVPYARATERFVPAQAVDPWEGIQEADAYGKTSYQAALLGMPAQNGSDNDNDCLNLNIWTPEPGVGGGRPVMVWLHGGGFSTGSANDEGYDGAALAVGQDVVVVGINHRLNAFGHLDLSAYGDKYRQSSNVGIIDIQTALQWVQDNIAVFGGDPGNITLFGQSGGGAKILALMAAPDAQGLFHRAIIQSGATEAMGVSFSSKEISERLGELTLQELSIAADDVEAIQDVGVDELLAASDAAREQTGREFDVNLALSADYGIEWGPVIDPDGYMPTAPVTDTGFAEPGRDVALLIGSNFSEWTHISELAQQTDITAEQTAAFEAAYPSRPATDATYVDSFIRLPMLKIMSHKADQGGADVYAYLFNYGDDPYHGAEIPYVFGRGEGSLGEQIPAAWASFASTGAPAVPGLPDWEPYTREGGATMLLDEDSELVHHHDRELMALLEPDYKY